VDLDLWVGRGAAQLGDLPVLGLGEPYRPGTREHEWVAAARSGRERGLIAGSVNVGSAG
jgi:predicted dienelactone hydrolase